MKTQWTKTWFCPAVLAACLFWAGPVLATFEVPDNCRFGIGTYTGDLQGFGKDASWSTETRLDKIDRVLFALENRAGRVFKNSTFGSAAVILSIADDGSFTGDIFNSVTGNRFQVQGNFANCVMTGTWTITIIQPDHKEYPKDTVLTGTFEITGAGSGESSGATNTCGILNVLPFSATILGMAAVQSRRARRRTRSVAF